MENENKVIPCENLPLSDEEIEEAAGGVIMATPLPNNTFICPVCKKRFSNALKTIYNDVEMCLQCKIKLSGK